MATKKETTLRCVLTLAIIAVICGLLLAVLNPLLYVEPSPDDIVNNFTIDGEIDATIEELNSDLAKGKGGKVLLVANLKVADKNYIGMTIKTNSDGQLGESTFAIYFDKSTNKLIQACYIKDGEGATAGRTYAAYGDKGANFDEYLITISSADVYADYTYPRTGATKTLKSVNNAFIIAANYYYNQYVLGGSNV